MSLLALLATGHAVPPPPVTLYPSPDTTPPPAPATLTLTPGPGTMTATWSEVTDNYWTVAGYEATIDGGAMTTVLDYNDEAYSLSRTYCTWSGLTPGASVTVAVKAFDAHGNRSTTSATAIGTVGT